MIKSIRSFLKSIDFFKSLTLLFAAIVPLGVFAWVGETALGVSVVMGVFLCAPSDIPGSIRHMTMGILVSAIIATVTTLVIHLSFISIWVLLPVLSISVFFNSMLSVYGFRASLVSFSGLLAIILSFAHPLSGTALLIHCGLIFSGGLWYLLVAMLAHLSVSRRHNQLILAECMALTAKHLQVRGRLLTEPDREKKLLEALFQLQTEINEKHEKLREIFVAERTRSGSSHFANKYILIFIELVDIVELSLSIPANHPAIHRNVSKKNDSLKSLGDILHAMGRQLHNLSEVISGTRKLSREETISTLYQQANESIDQYLQANQILPTNEEILLLKNLIGYEHKQLQKIENIERVLQDLVDQEHIISRSRDVEKFITTQDYDPGIFRQNLNGGSTIFRHAIRLTVTVLVGYAIGMMMHIQNPYWIMLTVVVIMRPSYGLTKSRSMQRVSGTLIGALIALGIVLLTQNPIIYGILAAISLVLAFSLIQKNYGGSAVFITLVIVFIYTLIQPDALNVIQFRVYDTAIGALLSFLASLLLWPSWEFTNINKVIAESIQSNRQYLSAISSYYQEKGELPTSYKLARKGAFLAFGNFRTAFQRMSQEPKSKQINLAATYEMVVLNHTFLAAVASMGTFIQNHRTTEKSEHFQAFIDAIDDNLKIAEAQLNNENLSEPGEPKNLDRATSYLDEQYTLLTREENQPDRQKLPKEKMLQLQELSLISGQLKWLYNLSENIRNATREMSNDSFTVS